MQKSLKMSLKEKNFQEMGKWMIFMILKKRKMTPEVHLLLPWGYISVHVYDYNSQAYWNISQISGERLQDHCSSGL